MFFTTVKIRLLGQYLSIALSSSLHLMACLLVSLPHSSKCANQEKLNLTCNVQGLQIWSNAISNDKDMGEKAKLENLLRGIRRERGPVAATGWLPSWRWSCCLSSAPFVTFICTKAGEMDSQQFTLPYCTDWYLGSLTALNCDDWACPFFFFISVVSFLIWRMCFPSCLVTPDDTKKGWAKRNKRK